MQRTDVFISYSRADRQWLDALLVHLRFLEKEHQFSIWEDSQIKPGSDWQLEIGAAMESAKVALLLVSANFLSSDFILEEELPQLLTAAREEGALIFPVIVSHCMFTEIPSLARFQTMNPPALPLVEMNQGEIDSLFLRITKEIRDALVTVGQKRTNDSNNIMLSLARICILAVLHDHAQSPGLQMSTIYKLAQLKSRKNIFSALEEMEKSGIINKKRIDTKTFWSLSERGTDLFEGMKRSYLF